MNYYASALKNFFFMLTKAGCIADLSFPFLTVLPDWLAVKVLIKNFLNIKTFFFADGFFLCPNPEDLFKPSSFGAIWISTQAATVLTATENFMLQNTRSRSVSVHP